MRKKLYAIHPGWVKAIDGDRHYIGFVKLIQLYKINPKDCINWDIDRPETFLGRNWDDYEHIFPGRYYK